MDDLLEICTLHDVLRDHFDKTREPASVLGVRVSSLEWTTNSTTYRRMQMLRAKFRALQKQLQVEV